MENFFRILTVEEIAILENLKRTDLAWKRLTGEGGGLVSDYLIQRLRDKANSQNSAGIQQITSNSGEKHIVSVIEEEPNILYYTQKSPAVVILTQETVRKIVHSVAEYGGTKGIAQNSANSANRISGRTIRNVMDGNASLRLTTLKILAKLLCMEIKGIES